MKWMGATLLAMAILGVWLTGGGVHSHLVVDAAPWWERGMDGKRVQASGHHRTGDLMNRLEMQPEGTAYPGGLGDAYASIRTQGDYRSLRKLLEGKSTNECFSILYGEFMGLRSRLGSRHDFDEKFAIINEFGGNRTADFKHNLLKVTGRSLDVIGDKDFITSLDPESWRTMVSGAAENQTSRAFGLAVADIGDTHQRIACAEVTRVWLGLDSVAASKRVIELPRGPLKDVAVGEMVAWLVRKGSADEAPAWIAEISDHDLREKMSALVRTQS